MEQPFDEFQGFLSFDDPTLWISGETQDTLLPSDLSNVEPVPEYDVDMTDSQPLMFDPGFFDIPSPEEGGPALVEPVPEYDEGTTDSKPLLFDPSFFDIPSPEEEVQATANAQCNEWPPTVWDPNYDHRPMEEIESSLLTGMSSFFGRPLELTSPNQGINDTQPPLADNTHPSQANATDPSPSTPVQVSPYAHLFNPLLKEPHERTDLPFEYMAGITVEELVIFFPFHCLRYWPAIALRIAAEGLRPREQMQLMNAARTGEYMPTGGKRLFAANQVRYHHHPTVRKFFEEQGIEYTEGMRPTREQFESIPWQLKDNRNDSVLRPAWTIRKLAEYFPGDLLNLPDFGPFTVMMKREYRDIILGLPSRHPPSRPFPYSSQWSYPNQLNPPSLHRGWIPGRLAEATAPRLLAEMVLLQFPESPYSWWNREAGRSE